MAAKAGMSRVCFCIRSRVEEGTTTGLALAAEAELLAVEAGIFTGFAEQGEHSDDDLCGEED